MSVFDNIIEKDGKIFNNQWVEWVHLFIPNKPKWFREFMRTVMRLFHIV